MKTQSDERLRSTREWFVGRSAELRERLERVRSDVADEVEVAIEQSARRELSGIERALERLEAGTFASCEVCGAEIDGHLLNLVPYATRCVRCTQDA